MSSEGDQQKENADDPTHEDLLARLRGPYIVNLLFRGYRCLQAQMVEQLSIRGYEGIGLAETRLLLSLDAEGTRIVTLAERTRTSKQFTGRVVQELEQRGYVETAPDPDDRRAMLVMLASPGRQYLLDIQEVKHTLDMTLVNVLGEEHMQDFVATLQKLIEHTDWHYDPLQSE